MANGIILSAGVRQNLLSLQATADLTGTVQNRLATGKKVNSALDNPSNFFTSQSLSDRASDLNSLLDSIGQAQKTLEATDKGLSSLTKLVQSAKSIATQARQATAAVSTYAAVNANSDISAAANLNGSEVIGSLTGNNTSLTAANFSAIAIDKDFTIAAAETVGTFTGTAAVPGTYTGGTLSFDVTIDGTTTTVTTAAIANDAADTAVRDAINTAVGASAVAGRLTASVSAGAIKLDASDSDVDFQINANALSAAVFLTTDASTDRTVSSTNLLDAIGSSGETLKVSVNGGADQTITFSNAGVSRISELNTALQALSGGVAASAASGANNLKFDLVAGQTSTLKITASNTAVRDQLGLNSGRTAGQGGGLGTGATDLSRTYNSAATLADADPTNLLNGGNLTISVNGSAQTVGLSGSDRLSDIISKLQTNGTLNDNLTFEESSGDLKITAKTSDVDFVVTHNNIAAAIGLTSGSNVTTNSTSLLDRLNTKLGGTNGEGTTLTVAANGGATQTITFGTGTGKVSTFAELSTALGALSGVAASLTGTSLNVQVASGTSATSLTIGGTAASSLGLTAGTTAGAVLTTTANSTRSSLEKDYNDVLAQLDTLAKDSSYNGINLLNGDDLKVVFNEKGTSSLTLKGVTFNSTGLGLNQVGTDTFQSNSQIDTAIGSLNSALTTLRTQAAKFGSNLSTVQTRQDFTKNLVTTLQTGADALVLADTNEEGANMLALQTRQQLSTTALSLANQASQAVLRLF